MEITKLILACCFLFSACDSEKKLNIISSNDSISTPAIRQNQKIENFSSFIKKFSSDSIFQKNRIIFPLNTKTYNIDTESFDSTLIKESGWEFFNIKDLNPKYIKKINKVSSNEYILNIQIIDTGVSIDYVFTIKNNQWFLTSIIDKST